MKRKLDTRGRVVIPKGIREELGLKPGMPVSICFRDGRIEIEPTSLSVRLVRKGQFLVAVPIKSPARLTTTVVEETRAALQGRTRFVPTS